MAALSALSVGQLWKEKLKLVHIPRKDSTRSTMVVSCQNRHPKKEEKNGLKKKIMGGVEKLQDKLSPKEKGDWKDVTLMSLSFAVYLYMSQKLVCAYCAWMSMPHPSW